ncbi:hypothetical protein [Kineococcus sp. SYSU DK003]|uniref:hypothetical protein n=1 Tax=Kineococcus sp. SYSU DK003 TaxID=3383124 RepID=UPI003D7D142B
MTIGSLARVLLHRWYLTIVVVALVAWFSRAAWTAAQPQYETSTTFLVTPSVALSTPLPENVPGTEPGSRNPFSLSGGATTLAATVSTALNTDTVQAGFMASFPEAQFSAAEATGSSGNRTYFTVTTATASPEEGSAVIAAALQAAAQQLLDVQRAVQAPDNGLFVIIQSTPIDGPVRTYPDRARAVGTVALGGLAAGVVLIVLVDAIIAAAGRSIGRRREATAQSTSTGSAPDGSEASTHDALGTPGQRDVDVRGPEPTSSHGRVTRHPREHAGSAARRP